MPEAACKRLQAHLDERLSHCLAAWGLPVVQGSRLQPGNAVSDVVRAADGLLQWQRSAASPGAWVAWQAAKVWQSALRDQLFPVGGGSARLASAVTNQAAEALQAEVSALAGGSLVPSDAPVVQAMRHGHWGITYEATLLAGLPLLMVWSCDALARQGWLEPAGALPSLPAWSHAQGFSQSRMRFELRVGDSDILLGDLGQLQVGDVLMLAQRMDEPLQLQSLDGSFQRSVYLGQFQGRRAAQFTPQSSK
jgi:hypothetical protein